jgi:hypothetical protein
LPAHVLVSVSALLEAPLSLALMEVQGAPKHDALVVPAESAIVVCRRRSWVRPRRFLVVAVPDRFGENGFVKLFPILGGKLHLLGVPLTAAQCLALEEHFPKGVRQRHGALAGERLAAGGEKTVAVAQQCSYLASHFSLEWLMIRPPSRLTVKRARRQAREGCAGAALCARPNKCQQCCQRARRSRAA